MTSFNPSDIAATIPPAEETKKKKGRGKVTEEEKPAAPATDPVVTAGMDVTENGVHTSIDEVQPSATAEVTPTDPPPPDEATDLDTPAAQLSVLVEVPIDVCHPGFASPRFDFRSTPRQAAAAKVLWSSVASRGDRYQGGKSLHPDGKCIENHNDGIRWLLDRLADSIEAETGKDLLRDFDLTFR